MSYGANKSCQEDYKGLSDKVEEQQAEIQELKNNLETMTDDLLVAKETLQKLSKDKSDLAKKQSSLKNKLQKANDVNEATLKDLLTIEDELQEENSKLVDKLRKSGSAAEPVRTKEGKVSPLLFASYITLCLLMGWHLPRYLGPSSPFTLLCTRSGC